MCTLRITMFGKFSVWIDGQPVDGLSASKVQELLCYLLLNRQRSHLREGLAGTLWGDSTTAQSKKYLRQALWQLQTTLEEYAPSLPGEFLLIDPNWIALNEDVPLWLDVAIFEETFEAVRGQPGEAVSAAQAADLQAAVDLYTGDLLEGCYHEWFWYDRERLQNMYLTMLDKLLAYHMAQGAYEAGIECGGRILRYDRARECTHQQLMILYARAGQRSAALRQYQRCVEALDEELGVHPSQRTEAIYQDVRVDALDDGAGEVRGAVAALPQGSAALTDVLGRLEQLWVVLGDLQRRVEQEIHSVHDALSDHP